MDTEHTSAMLDRRKMLLSTLWIFVFLNYLYGDIVGLMDAGLLRQYLAGEVNGMRMTEGFLLASSLMMEIPIAMILLSRVLRRSWNRIVNIAAGTFMSLVIIATLFVGSPTLYYIFWSVVEVAGTVFIVWYAARWPKPEALAEGAAERRAPSVAGPAMR